RDRAEHYPWHIRCASNVLETGLRTRYNETRKCGAFEAGAHLCGTVLKAPRQGGIEIRARLNSGWCECRTRNDRWQCEREGQVWRKAIPDQLTNRGSRAIARGPSEDSFVETPFPL